MIDTVYAEICDQLKAQVTALKWIDLEAGQLDEPTKNFVPAYPAAFIDFENIDWDDAGEKMQDGLFSIAVRVAFRIYEQTHGNDPGNPSFDARANAMTKLQLINTIHAALQGFSDGATFNAMSRYNTTTERRDDGLKVITMKYRCEGRDKSAMKTYTMHTATKLNVILGITGAHGVLTMTVNDETPAVADQVTFTLTVENTGDESATGTLVTFLLPAGLVYVSDDGGGDYVSGTGAWTIGTLAAGGSATLSIVAQVAPAGSTVCEAELTYNEIDPDPSDTTATITLTVAS